MLLERLTGAGVGTKSVGRAESICLRFSTEDNHVC